MKVSNSKNLEVKGVTVRFLKVRVTQVEKMGITRTLLVFMEAKINRKR